MTFEYLREIARTWFDRRDQGQNAFDRFIYVWIAFNAVLSARYGAGRERDKVESFGRELAAIWDELLQRDGQLREAAAELERMSPIYSESPRDDERRKRTRVTAGDGFSVMLGIYAVRNNLFHGSKRFDNDRDDALVITSTRAMERIFVGSGVYDMASGPGRELEEDLRISADGDVRAAGSKGRGQRP